MIRLRRWWWGRERALLAWLQARHFPKAQEHLRCWELCLALTEHEGDTVTVLPGNPEGPPNWGVMCQGDWTDWETQTFYGDSLVQCLEDANLAMGVRYA